MTFDPYAEVTYGCPDPSPVELDRVLADWARLAAQMPKAARLDTRRLRPMMDYW